MTYHAVSLLILVENLTIRVVEFLN